jgi:hypothetical protein
MSDDNETSEFGKGYAYCLGLFLAHAERGREYPESSAHLWFYGASDHLRELEIPKTLPRAKQGQIESFRNRCVSFGQDMRGEGCTRKDISNALNEAKDLLREWDEFHEIPSQKGQWE